jgi:hypothetical protein
VIALLALALAPLARVLGLLGPARRAVNILHMVHELIVVLRRTPRALLPLALRLRILPDRVLVM